MCSNTKTKHSCILTNMQSFPLIVKDDDEAIERDEAVISSFPILWDQSYQPEFRDEVRNAINRGKEQIKKRGKLRDAKLDVFLTLKRIKPNNVHLRGDYRYSSEKMSKFLKTTDFDLVPPLVGVTSSGLHLLDGHHRWRAYLDAGIDPLVLMIEVKPSTSDIPQVHVDSIVDQKKHVVEQLLREFVLATVNSRKNI